MTTNPQRGDPTVDHRCAPPVDTSDLYDDSSWSCPECGTEYRLFKRRGKTQWRSLRYLCLTFSRNCRDHLIGDLCLCWRCQGVDPSAEDPNAERAAQTADRAYGAGLASRRGRLEGKLKIVADQVDSLVSCMMRSTVAAVERATR